MNAQSNAVPESSFGSQVIVPAPMSATRPLLWSVRRELWEHRSIYVAPLAVAAVFLCGFLISTAAMPHKMRGVSTLDPAHQHAAIAQPYDFAAGLLMVTQILVGVFYCLDALYGERRDRSILFWKSLPVSDLTTVLSKASVPLLILPLLAFSITVVTQLIMRLLSTAVLLGSGQTVATLWARVTLLPMWLGLLYHLVVVHGLWHAPFYGWMLLVSAWARRAPFLWAALPVIAISVLEKIVFNTSYFAMMLGERLAGGPEGIPWPTHFPSDPGMELIPGKFLGSPGLWLGLLITAAFLAAAVRLRRYREPI